MHQNQETFEAIIASKEKIDLFREHRSDVQNFFSKVRSHRKLVDASISLPLDCIKNHDVHSVSKSIDDLEKYEKHHEKFDGVLKVGISTTLSWHPIQQLFSLSIKKELLQKRHFDAEGVLKEDISIFIAPARLTEKSYDFELLVNNEKIVIKNGRIIN